MLRRLLLSLAPAALALMFWAGPHSPGAAQQAKPPAADETDVNLLKSAGLSADPKSLHDFFVKRALKGDARKELENLVTQLDAKLYKERKQAQEELLKRGSVALPFLKKAAKGGSLEMTRRAEELIRIIERGPGPELPAAAARLLAAAKDPPRGSLAALLEFLPFADDEWLEEELLKSLGTLWLRVGRADTTLTDALKDKRPEWRAPAAYVIAQRGGMEQRETVRRLLDDPDTTVRSRAAAGLIGKRAYSNALANAGSDETLLRGAGVALEGTALVQFLKDRSLDEKALQEVKTLIGQLGDKAWGVREKASARLVKLGQPVVPFLKLATEQEVLEVSMRATKCVEQIKLKANAALPAAAARLLSRSGDPLVKPGPNAVTADKAIAALLAYVPFSDDETVEDEVLASLCVLSVRQPKVDPQLLAALDDAQAFRRGGAAYVLGRSGTRDDCAGLKRLLDDSVLKVRLRAAQGLLAAGDRASLPALVDLLGRAPDTWSWRVEELLQKVAADRAPEIPHGANLADYRKKAATAWAKWLRERGSDADLSLAGSDEQRVGVYTIVEYDSVGGRGGQGKIWEAGRDFNPRWTVGNLMGPMDAHVLPNGRVLVAEANASKVTERDMKGNVVWEYQVNRAGRNAGSPVVVQRLPNGNTFIASYYMLEEVNPAKETVWSHSTGFNSLIFDARRLRNGHIVYINSQGQIVELNAQRQQVKTINVGNQGNWCSVEPLPNGRYLVAQMNTNEVREVDAGGQTRWKATFQGVFRATRLPNGNTLVASMTTRQIAEIDRNGNRVWEKTCDGRPWRIVAR